MPRQKLYVWYDHPFFYGRRLFDIYDPPLNGISPNDFGYVMDLNNVSFSFVYR